MATQAKQKICHAHSFIEYRDVHVLLVIEVGMLEM